MPPLTSTSHDRGLIAYLSSKSLISAPPCEKILVQCLLALQQRIEIGTIFSSSSSAWPRILDTVTHSAQANQQHRACKIRHPFRSFSAFNFWSPDRPACLVNFQRLLRFGFPLAVTLMRRFLAVCLVLLIVGYGDNATDLYDTRSWKRSRTTGRTPRNFIGRS